VRWNSVEVNYGCEVGFVTILYWFIFGFLYRNSAIVCMVHLIKLFYYRDFGSSLFLLSSLLATSNVAAGKTVTIPL